MPTITVNTKDMLAQASVPVPAGKLPEILSSLKCELECEADGEITVDVNSDRPDLFSSEGIARAIRYYLSGSKPYEPKRYIGAPLRLTVDPSTKSIRPLIVCAAIRGIPLTSEATKQLMQLQEKLHNTYASNRKKASIGVYDLNKVSPGFTYAALPPDEISFVPLDCTEKMSGRQILDATPKGKDYASILAGKDLYPLLMDSKKRVLSMPPIINSEETRVTEATKDIFIDVTGLDEKAIDTCLNLMATSILERGGALQAVDVCYQDRTVTTPRMDRRTQRLTHASVKSVSGLDMSIDDIGRLLNRMGFQSSSASLQGAIDVEVPPFRVDILHEIDLVEDVIIAYGLNRMGPDVPKVMTFGKLLPSTRLLKRVRDLMVGSSFQEIATYVLSNREVMEDKSLLPRRSLVEIVKPISSEYTVLRDSLLPKLLQFLGCNTHISYPQRIFEYGHVVRMIEGRPINVPHLAAAMSDHKISFEQIQAVAAALFKNLSKEVKFAPHSEPVFIEGRAAKVLVEGFAVGTIGEINPQALVNFGINCPVAAFECDMSKFAS